MGEPGEDKGDYQARWIGGGTDGQRMVYGRHRTGYKGYWRFQTAENAYVDAQFCDHAHRTPDAAALCGEREARNRNRANNASYEVPDAGQDPQT